MSGSSSALRKEKILTFLWVFIGRYLFHLNKLGGKKKIEKKLELEKPSRMTDITKLLVRGKTKTNLCG